MPKDTWHFAKYHGAGNDFIIIQDLKRAFPFENAQEIARLCHRQFGVGADGLILLQYSSVADYKMRIFNADGGEASMCGNGLRCLVKYLDDFLNTSQKEYYIESLKSIHRCYLHENRVVTNFGKPSIRMLSKILEGEEVHLIDTGVPHLVRFTADLDNEDVQGKGRFWRYHPAFSPEGVNVTFAACINGNCLNIRTYERGIEGETLACGTGAAAAAAAAALLYRLKSPIEIRVSSGETLVCYVCEAQGEIDNLFLEGSAYFVFRGQVHA